VTAVQGFLELLDTNVARYPLLTGKDAYKLLYQGVLGPEHLAADPEAFAERLRAEFAAVPPAAPLRLRSGQAMSRSTSRCAPTAGCCASTCAPSRRREAMSNNCSTPA